MGNKNRSLIGAEPIPEMVDGRVTWNIRENQLGWMEEKAGNLMADRARRLLADQNNKPLNKNQLSGTRDAVGAIYVIGEDGVPIEYNFRQVGSSVKSNLNPKAKTKYPALKPGAAGGPTARQLRTEMANKYVIDWAGNLDERRAWPEGKSLAGYESWLRKNYADLQKGYRIDLSKILGKEQDTGHGKVSYELGEGMSSKSNLAVQDAFGLYGNRNLAQMYIPVEGDTLESISKKTGVAPKVILESNKVQNLKIKPGEQIRLQNIVKNTEDIRSVADADAADIAWRNWDAFEEYLFEGKDTYIDKFNTERSVLNMSNFTPQQRRAVLFDPEFAASAEAAQFKIRDEIKVNAAHKRMVQRRSQKIGGKLSKADAGLRLVAAAATGDLVGGSLAFGQLSMQHALRNPSVQKNIAKQIAELSAKRAAKTGAKLIPGLDIALSAMEAGGYLSEGKFDQAAIATLSGAIGWIPIIGDGAAAALDLSNTGIDIARLDWDKKPEIVETPTADTRKKEYQDLMYNDYLTDEALNKFGEPAPQKLSIPDFDTNIPRIRGRLGALTRF